MQDLFAQTQSVPEIVPARKLAAEVAGLYGAFGGGFQTERVDSFDVGFEGIEGIEGDVHAGVTRRSGGREPWYRRGTEIRNERQLSIVAADELAVVAERMGVAEIRPEWIGANLVIAGLRRLSLLPSGTLLFFENGATIKVDGQNHPCRLAGRAVADKAGMADANAGSLAFVNAAKRLRGLVAWVEKPGRITIGESIAVRVPEQTLYLP